MSPRKPKILQTDDPSRHRFAAWLAAVKEGQYRVAFGDSRGVGIDGPRFGKAITQAKISGEAAITDRYLRDLLSGAAGPSLNKCWDLGEALATFPGRKWCAGILAVAAVPIYRIHVLRWIGALLRENGPNKDVRAMWSLLANLATEPALFSRPFLTAKWTEEQRRISARAWSHRGNVDDPIPADTPAMLIAAITLQSAIGYSGDLTLTIADAAMREAMHAWFDGLEREWKHISNF